MRPVTEVALRCKQCWELLAVGEDAAVARMHAAYFKSHMHSTCIVQLVCFHWHGTGLAQHVGGVSLVFDAWS